MKKIILEVLIVFILSAYTFAQSAEQKITMLDEFGKVSLEDLAARLDYLRNELEKNPTNKAVIKIYGGQEDFFAFPYIRGAVVKAYLKNNRKLSVENFSIQFCNVNQESIRTQFFLVEKNEQIALCNESLTVPEKTVLFENLYFYFDSTFSSKKPFEETFIDVVGSSEQEYSQTSQNALLNLLRKSPESKIYLIGYLGTNFYTRGNGEEVRKLDKPKTLNKIFKQIETEFIQSGIDASRIIKINGGYQDSAKNVEIWFAPKDGEVPKPKPDYFPKKRQSKK